MIYCCIKLFVDDVRQCPVGWEKVTTVLEAVRLLSSGVVSELSLDHDIMHENGRGPGAYCSCPENYSTIARYVAIMPKEFCPQRVWLHSANPGGRDIMRKILKEAGVDVKDRPIDHPFGEFKGSK